MQLVYAQKGRRLKVKEMAERLGVSSRTLERLFVEETCVPPKKLARILHFQNALTIPRAGRFCVCADLALASGYVDQSHLIKDFKALAGKFLASYRAPKISRFYRTCAPSPGTHPVSRKKP